jgi:uncharacterized protein (DUF362 family)
MIDLLHTDEIAVYREENLSAYHQDPPFNPSGDYPEYPFKGQLSGAVNGVYEAVRNCFLLYGLDAKKSGGEEWNPLGEIISPGDTVVIKPNFVLDRHHNGGNWQSIITHPSVIRAVCDYAYIALQGSGQIIIADAPQANCDFDNLLETTKLPSIAAFYQEQTGTAIPIHDLRQLKLRDFKDSASRVIQEGDPAGYTIINMGEDSSFIGAKNLERLYGSDYDRSATTRHHHDVRHEYCVSNTVLAADVVLSVPKMKVHRKAGVTLNMKNLIGINGNKNYLPHYKIGLPEDGGDEFPSLTPEQKTVMKVNRMLSDKLFAKPNIVKDQLYKIAKLGYRMLRQLSPKRNVDNVILGGDWHGNDTVWRTLLDLNKIFLYSDKKGLLSDNPQRKFFSIVDGIIGGENEGPLVPTDKLCGVIACGGNPLVVDMAVTRIMGFEPKRISKFKQAARLQKYPLSRVKPEKIIIHSNQAGYKNAMHDHKNPFLGFIPAKGWLGTIEYDKSNV